MPVWQRAWWKPALAARAAPRPRRRFLCRTPGISMVRGGEEDNRSVARYGAVLRSAAEEIHELRPGNTGTASRGATVALAFLTLAFSEDRLVGAAFHTEKQRA